MAKEHPLRSWRLNNLRVTVWENRTNGTRWFTTVITRHFKDGDTWRDVPSFNGPGDLALAIAGANLANDFILKEQEKDFLESKEIEEKAEKAANSEATRPSAAAAGKRRSVNNKPSRE